MKHYAVRVGNRWVRTDDTDPIGQGEYLLGERIERDLFSYESANVVARLWGNEARVEEVG